MCVRKKRQTRASSIFVFRFLYLTHHDPGWFATRSANTPRLSTATAGGGDADVTTCSLCVVPLCRRASRVGTNLSLCPSPPPNVAPPATSKVFSRKETFYCWNRPPCAQGRADRTRSWICLCTPAGVLPQILPWILWGLPGSTPGLSLLTFAETRH